MKYLIYAAYGSNLLKERFMVYIKSGIFEDIKYDGCSDKTDPVDLGWIRVPHRLYFAKKSPKWDNKGVAFLSLKKEDNPEFNAIVRLWKISEIQFRDLQAQEGKGWYNKILFLGEKDGLPIKTITGDWENEKECPSKKYIEIIIKGLKETTGWDEIKIEEYIKKFL